MRSKPLRSFEFHGGGGEADGQRDHSQMNPLADREGFIVVYPNGTGSSRSLAHAGMLEPACGYAMKIASMMSASDWRCSTISAAGRGSIGTA